MCFQDEGCRRHATGFCEISFSFSAAASQNEAEESDESEDEATGERTSRVRRPRGGMKVAARIGERLQREIGIGDRKRQTPLSQFFFACVDFTGACFFLDDTRHGTSRA